MGDFATELLTLENKLKPQGGYGFQNLGALQALLQRQSAFGERRAIGSDFFQLDRAGLGNSVGKAFSAGTRKRQFTQSLMDALARLNAQNSQLAGSQRQSLLGTLAPVAEREANRPSFLSTLLGGLGGLGAQALAPGIGGKLFPNPLLKMLMGQQGSREFQ